MGMLQGSVLAVAADSSLADLSPLTLEAIGGMAGAAKTDSKKIADCLQSQAGCADAQKRYMPM